MAPGERDEEEALEEEVADGVLSVVGKGYSAAVWGSASRFGPASSWWFCTLCPCRSGVSLGGTVVF